MDYRIFKRACVISLVRAYKHFDSKKLKTIYCAPDGVRTSDLWISSPTLNQLSHAVTPWQRNKLKEKQLLNKKKTVKTGISDFRQLTSKSEGHEDV